MDKALISMRLTVLFSGDIWPCLETFFGYHSWVAGVLLVSRGYRPGVVFSTCNAPASPHTKTYPSPDANRAEVGKPCSNPTAAVRLLLGGSL